MDAWIAIHQHMRQHSGRAPLHQPSDDGVAIVFLLLLILPVLLAGIVVLSDPI